MNEMNKERLVIVGEVVGMAMLLGIFLNIGLMFGWDYVIFMSYIHIPLVYGLFISTFSFFMVDIFLAIKTIRQRDYKNGE